MPIFDSYIKISMTWILWKSNFCSLRSTL